MDMLKRVKFTNPKAEDDLNVEIGEELKCCPICLVKYEEGEELVVLSCDDRHFFHKECITDWL